MELEELRRHLARAREQRARFVARLLRRALGRLVRLVPGPRNAVPAIPDAPSDPPASRHQAISARPAPTRVVRPARSRTSSSSPGRLALARLNRVTGRFRVGEVIFWDAVVLVMVFLVGLQWF